MKQVLIGANYFQEVDETSFSRCKFFHSEFDISKLLLLQISQSFVNYFLGDEFIVLGENQFKEFDRLKQRQSQSYIVFFQVKFIKFVYHKDVIYI